MAFEHDRRPIGHHTHLHHSLVLDHNEDDVYCMRGAISMINQICHNDQTYFIEKCDISIRDICSIF